jgi:transcriptional regulator with GAF, ATPase, and Fis domain
LLRVLQEQEFERVGGTVSIKVDVRIIATTNRDLAAFSAAGHFRRDLFFRLSVIPLSIPPLRERPGDIPLLSARFATRVAAEMSKEVKAIAPETMSMLQSYEWPGNVRELQHAIERAVILSADTVLQPESFDAHRFGLTESGSGPSPRRTLPTLAALIEGELGSQATAPVTGVVLTSLDVGEAERTLIARALEVSGGNRTRAAELLGMSIRTLRSKLSAPGA